MGVLSRIGIALDSDLLKRLDRSISKRGYTNRSEAFRDLIRDQLVTQQIAAPSATVVGTFTLIYDHDASELPERLMELQHEHQHENGLRHDRKRIRKHSSHVFLSKAED
jgi:CopG family transcriptional regulator, nickel-responsive regulator